MALRKGDKIGPFTLKELLGEGSFAEVWLATREGIIPISVAVKVLRRAFRTALEQEASTWNEAMPHPHILPILEAGEYDGYLLLVTEYAPGGSLTEHIKKHGEPDLETSLRWLEGTLSGLAHLHERKIIHRDVSLNNIVVQGGVARLMDFGLSRLQEESVMVSRAIGTLSFMAPEIFKGERSEEGDIWAWGVLAYRLLTGRYPFTGDSDIAIMHAIQSQTLPPLPNTVPASFRPLIRKALGKDRKARWSSAQELRTWFQAALQEWHATKLRDEIQSLTLDLELERENTILARESILRLEKERNDLQRLLDEAHLSAQTDRNRADRHAEELAQLRLPSPQSPPSTQSLSPKTGAEHNSKGIKLENVGNYGEAEAAYRAAIRRRPKYAEAHLNLGDVLRKQDKNLEAEAAYKKAIALKPDFAIAYNNLGFMLEYQHKYREAEAAYNKAIVLKPDFIIAFNNLGSALLGQQKYKEAESAYNEAIVLNSDDATAYNGLGNALNGQKQHKEAEEAYKKAIELRTAFAITDSGLDNRLQYQHKSLEAEANYKKAIEIKPDFATIYRNLGNAFYGQQKYQEAETAYRKAIEITPHYDYAYNGLGNALYAQQKYLEAEAAYKKAIEIKPDYCLAHANLAWPLMKLNRRDEAIAVGSKARALGYQADNWALTELGL